MKYNLAFTAGALLYNESLHFIQAIDHKEDYLKNDFSVQSDVLVTNAESSRKRIKSELDKRLKNLDVDYLNKFSLFMEQDQKVILFLAICKTYSIITEFALEVVFNKWKNFDNELSTYDFKYYLSSKLSEEQLNSISEHSLYKLSQVAVKMFKDVGVFKEDKLSTVHISDELVELLKTKGDAWFLPCILNPSIEEAE
ncbi:MULTISPECIES: BrxA family protein [Empedobacter]|uniref:BrxA family protein n=1 Tax=Empedobacter TaxID=59734 RepID=UPI0025779E24|nr:MULTISPECIES: BrxA family protein [Empedobacter]MDM1041933.1 DUF1819 family protein [Empedobacter brevis]MDM1135864.1 DUF1819 family protein [Empedobacter sp. R750]